MLKISKEPFNGYRYRCIVQVSKGCFCTNVHVYTNAKNLQQFCSILNDKIKAGKIDDYYVSHIISKYEDEQDADFIESFFKD